MPTIRVQAAPFDPGVEIAAILANRTDIGGLGCFLGIVRDTAGGKPITAMTLEHYPGMTERALAAIVAQAHRRWPLLDSTVVHRFGSLQPGEPIVLVLTTSLHRQAALDATAFLIDWLKTSAPFWKQEQFSSGDTAWVAAQASDDAARERWATERPRQPSAPDPVESPTLNGDLQ